MVDKFWGKRDPALLLFHLSLTYLVLVPQNVIYRELRHPELARRELRTEDGAGVANVGHEQFLIDDDGGGGRAPDSRLQTRTCSC